jgi:SOS response regulatory protein OraA/RecX
MLTRPESRMTRTVRISETIFPRLLRLRDAPLYLGMDRNRFNSEVRPYLTEIPIGNQGIAFDRLEMDAWIEDYKFRNGRPGQPRGELTWDEKERQVSTSKVISGISTNKSGESAFAKALARATSGKRKPILPVESRRSGKQGSTE